MRGELDCEARKRGERLSENVIDFVNLQYHIQIVCEYIFLAMFCGYKVCGASIH